MMQIQLRGTTVVRETPPLEIYFKTATGHKMRGHDSDFPIKGITATTRNAAVPVFAKLADAATHSLRITHVELSGGTANYFAWLDSTDKIEAISVPERCTVSSAPVPVRPNGITLIPQGNTVHTMPLLGCINFQRDPSVQDKRRQFDTTLTVTTVALDAKNQSMKRADGSLAESQMQIHVTATISPRTGHLVLRLSQTMAILMIRQKPTVASGASLDELEKLVAVGRATNADRFIFLGAIIVDPFDEMEIHNEDGSIATTPDDGITGIFRAIDTRPAAFTGTDTLFPYTSLTHDNLAPEGHRGIFFDYPQDKLPQNYQGSSLRIYTAALSWPGPLAEPDKIPQQVSDCQQVDPCERPELLGKGPDDPSTHRGVCAFFYASAGGKDSPGMYRPDERADGTRDNLCKSKTEPQKLTSLKGHATTDGRLMFEDSNLRFWGPTFIHNIANGLPQKPAALDDVFRITFTTDVIVPKEEGGKFNYLPEKRIDLAKQEYKVNLNDNSRGDPVVCEKNKRNRFIADKAYSSWKYFAPLLVQDKEGKIPAGCPDDGLPVAGGRAYLRGRPVDPATGIFSISAVTKFGADEDLTFVFKDASLYVVLNGWLCDPLGSEAEGEGSKCFDQTVGPRDAASQISIVKEGM
jgi:hypothetical protein